jgi:hypothetical protein
MKKKIILTLFSLVLCFSTYHLCHFIAKKFFFDKFFYYKSTKYGYWVLNQNLTLNDFGKRAQDLNLLTNNSYSQVLGTEDNNVFKIAVFGDSMTWGQGVSNKQRFISLLEKKLNKIRPTKIYSFANCGDNLFDHYTKYQLSQKILSNINLYIFALLNNDLVFNQDDRYHTNDFLKEISSDCSGDPIFDPIFPEGLNADFNTPRELSLDKNSLNFCVYKKLIPLLPKEKTLYIDLGSITTKNQGMQKTFSDLINTDLPMMKTNFEEICTNPLLCQVSKADGHPSALIHKYYSNILFNEITTNNKLYFKSQNE